MRFELYSRYGRVDPEALKDRVINYCLGMPGVDGVTPGPREVNLLNILEKLEQEYNYLRSLPKNEAEEHDRELTEEKLVEIVIDCVPDWCNEAVELAREASRQQTGTVCGLEVPSHQRWVKETRRPDKSVK